MVKKKVIWSSRAWAAFEDAIRHIKKDSPQSAQKVKKDIIAAARELGHQPEMYPEDRYKTENDGSYRAFEKHRYRIMYRNTQETIQIIRFRHSSQEPLEY